MGAEIGIGALLGAAGISALGNLGGSAISAAGSEKANAQALAFNEAQAKANREWQEKMYNQQLVDQERMYNQYQSPEAIAKQLEKIGVNGAGAFANGKTGFSGSMAGVPSVPSGSQASIGSLENPYASFGNALQNTTKDAVSVLNSLTDKHLKDAQTLKVLAEKKGQEYANQIAKIQAQVSEWHIPEKSRAEINSLITRAALNEANGKFADAQTSLKELMSKLTDKQIKLTDEQIQQLTIEVAWLDRIRKQEFELLGEKKNTEKSQQAANYGAAEHSHALAIESGTRKAGIEFENVVKQIDSEQAVNTAIERLNALVAKYKSDENVSKKQALEAEKEATKLRERLKHYKEYSNAAKFDEFWDNFPIIGGIVRGLAK